MSQQEQVVQRSVAELEGDLITGDCGCSNPIVLTPWGWQHDSAPWYWGDDHDPGPDQETEEQAAVWQTEYDEALEREEGSS